MDWLSGSAGLSEGPSGVNSGEDEPGSGAADAGAQLCPAAPTPGQTVLMVCTSCRRPEDSEAVPRPGEGFARAVRQAAEGTPVAVKGIRCLGNCSRGLSAALIRERGVIARIPPLDFPGEPE